MSNQIKTIVSLKGYVPHDQVARELRARYYEELEINDRLNIESDLEIQYYGLVISDKIIDDQKLIKDAINHHFALRSVEYKKNSVKRKKHSIKRVYRGDPGDKLEICIKKAIHFARADLFSQDLNDISESSWVNWVFYFGFNSMEYPFNPLVQDVSGNIRKAMKS